MKTKFTFLLLIFISLFTQAQIIEVHPGGLVINNDHSKNFYNYPYQIDTVTMDSNTPLDVSLSLTCLKYFANTVDVNDSFHFRFYLSQNLRSLRLSKYFQYDSVYQSVHLSKDGSDSFPIHVNLPSPKETISTIDAPVTTIASLYQLAGTYNFRIRFPNARVDVREDTIKYILLRVNNANCHPYFKAIPTDTPGVYQAYNGSTGSNLKYRWSFGDGDTSDLAYPMHNYATPGKYQICLIVENEVSKCMDEYCDSSFLVFKTEGGLMSKLVVTDQLIVTGLEAAKEEPIHLYPNPASDELTIYNDGKQISEVAIWNTSGQVVAGVKQPANNRISIADLPAGIYIAEVKWNNTVSRIRWVKL